MEALSMSMFRIFILMALASCVGCKDRGSSAYLKDDGTTVGSQITGTVVQSPPGKFTFTFTDSGGTTTTRTGTEGDTALGVPAGEPMIVENNSFGLALNQVHGLRNTWYTNMSWTCQNAETFALGATAITSATQKCFVEIDGTGPASSTDNAVPVTLTIIPVESNANWIGAPTSAPPAVNGGAPQLISAGPPSATNTQLDPAVKDKLVEAFNHFGNIDGLPGGFGPAQQRLNCITLPLISGWTDLAAQYYCIFPHDQVRACFTGQILAVAKKGVFGIAARQAAYATCFPPDSNPDGTANVLNPERRWIRDNQADVFQYILFTDQGTADFNIESENSAINQFYSEAEPNVRRTSRKVDTFPWTADQPRYNVIRRLQTGGSALANGTAVSQASSGTHP